MSTEREYVEGTQIDVDGNETPILFDNDLLVEEGFKVVQLPIYNQRHYSRRGPFMLPEFWADVWDKAVLIIIWLVVMAALIFGLSN